MSGAPVPPFAFTIRLISFQLLIAMPNYYYIPPEQKQLICRLSLSLKTSEIAFHTGISIRTIQRVIRLWQTTGSVMGKPLHTGRQRALAYYHISVRAYLPHSYWYH